MACSAVPGWLCFRIGLIDLRVLAAVLPSAKNDKASLIRLAKFVALARV